MGGGGEPRRGETRGGDAEEGKRRGRQGTKEHPFLPNGGDSSHKHEAIKAINRKLDGGTSQVRGKASQREKLSTQGYRKGEEGYTGNV